MIKSGDPENPNIFSKIKIAVPVGLPLNSKFLVD